MKIPYTLKLIYRDRLKYLKVLFFYGIVIKILNFLTFGEFRENYGDFHFKDNFDRYPIDGLNNYTERIAGTLVYFIKTLPFKEKQRVLLAGEDNKVKAAYSGVLGSENIVTAGLSPEADFNWNFENNPPKNIGQFDLIISQAVIEHLINPFKHLSDLSKLISKNGFLLVQAVIPGFGYHRVPIDCFRFYPDWFEEAAKKLGLKVEDKGIHNAQICYKFRKV